MPNYSTDFETYVNGIGTTRGVTAVDNIADYREAKIIAIDCAVSSASPAVITSYKPNTTTASAHGLAIGDAVAFTTSIGSIVANTVYKVGTKSFAANTFTLKDVAGNEINNTGSAGTSQFVKADGETSGMELLNVTDTLRNFADLSADTIPATSGFAGKSVMAKITKEIASFYDALDARRAYSTTAKTVDAPGFITVVNAAGDRVEHGLVVGDGVAITTTVAGLTKDTKYYVVPIVAAATDLNELFTLNGHAFPNDTPITVTAVDVPNKGIVVGKTYYVANTLANTFTLKDAVGGAATLLSGDISVSFTTPKAFAVSATANGAAINISADGDVKLYKWTSVFTTQELAYLANMNAIQLNDLTKIATRFAYRLKKLTNNILNSNAHGVPGDSMYPSGNDNDWNKSNS